MKKHLKTLIGYLKIDRESFRCAVNCFLIFVAMHLATGIIFSAFASPTVMDMARKDNGGYRELTLFWSFLANVATYGVIGKYIMIFMQDRRREVIESFRTGSETILSLVRKRFRLIGYATMFSFIIQLPFAVIHALIGLPYKVMVFFIEVFAPEFIYYELTGLTLVGLILMPLCTFAIYAGIFALRFYIWKREA
jgi:hypothetical protein